MENQEFISVFLRKYGMVGFVDAKFRFTILQQNGVPSIDMSRASQAKTFKFGRYPSVDERGEFTILPVTCSDLNQCLVGLLNSGDGADVTFLVKGTETFMAHSFVLAARSDVFKKTLFGQKRWTNPITVDDIEAPIFKSMLDYIYSDWCPEIEKNSENINDDEKEKLRLMTQRLLIAAEK
ncbi:hypothetical protein LUZ61_002656 [Rhynchospora tenuis]|uniref:BTB domain-containing protein n=1 Tax=Rhynchospora tenuis TaxID=198213 RepID=A0AAD6ES14_9POAL|nr:hypothetical protein LUZ61_002656 [Rhynchospora tenuis]